MRSLAEKYIEEAICQHLETIVDSSVSVRGFLVDDATTSDNELRALPCIDVSALPTQVYQNLIEVPIEINITTNNLKDKKRSVLAGLIKDVHEALGADQITAIDAYIPENAFLSGFGLWSNGDRDIVQDDKQVINFATFNLTAFMYVTAETTTTTTTSG